LEETAALRIRRVSTVVLKSETWPALPSTAFTKPSMKVAKPKAPESTTPFSLRTGRSSGVRATDS
jgi:hypothetical protein